MSSTALQVSWEPPHENLTHGTVLGYYLGYKDDRSVFCLYEMVLSLCQFLLTFYDFLV